MAIRFLYTSLFFLFINSVQAATIDISKLPPQTQMELSASPIGDNINVSIYDFILSELMKHQNVSKAQIKDIEEQEKQSLKDPNDIKSYTADISETQFSHILTALCKGTANCRSLVLYQNDGLLIGLADPYENASHSTPKSLAFLTKNPLGNLGIQKLNCKNGFCEYLITWAIYRLQVRPNDFVGDLSFLPPSRESGQPIGFLQIVKRVKI